MASEQPGFRLPGAPIAARPATVLRHPLAETDAMRHLRVTLRAETPGDLGFLQRLYAAGRAAEMLMLDHWDRDTKRDFLERQFEYQYRHHSAHYSAADFTIVQLGGAPAGRLYLHWGEAVRDCRLFELQLLPELRGRGIGSALISALLQRAAGLRYTVSLHVEPINPARRLYARFGFVETGAELGSGSIRMQWFDGPTRPAMRLAG